MDGAMGQEEDVVEAVLTCEGDFHDPELYNRIERFRHRLKDLLLTDKRKLQVKKVEPWNSVKVTVTIPREAAIRLRQLAQNGNDALRQIGVLSVQIQGDSQISLTIAGHNNEPTHLVLRTATSASQGASTSTHTGLVGADSSISNTDRFGSPPGPSNDEVTRKNIVDIFRQGPAAMRQNSAIFDSILGSGAASTSGLGMGLGIPPPPDTFSGLPGGNPPFRPNNITTTVLQSQALRGSHLSSFPFTKTTGAFHAPVPRLPPSAGQSSAPTSSHLLQSGNNSTSRFMGHEASGISSGLSNSGPSHHGLMNSFSPVGSVRLPPASSNTQGLHVPPSSSPSFMDLPPPPPYPHNTNSSSRPGKPVTASSPLLVNLLQTEPQLVAAGMASGNPNKPLTDGDNSGSPPKKKRRPKKNKDGVLKPYLLNENTVSSRPGLCPHMPTSSADVSRISRVAEDFAGPVVSTPVHVRDSFSVNLVQSRANALPAGNIPDSFIPGLRPDSRPLFSSDRPFSESHMDNPSLAGFQSDSSSRSAIGAASSSSKLSDSNGREPFPKDLDPFSMEIAAGKIINPYTGQLEPRDSVVDSGPSRVKDQSSHSQGDNSAMQMLAKKAKELEDINEKCVPNSSSSSDVMDVNVMRTVIPTPISVSTSTAAFVRSGGSSSQVPSEKLTSSVPSHRRNFISDGTAREPRESSAPSTIYAGAATKPWQEFVGSADVGVRSAAHTMTNSSPLKVASAVSSSLQKNFAPTSVPLNGPVAGGQTLKPNVIPPQHQHIGPSSSTSGALHAPSGSVIYSSVTITSSSPLPISHPARVTQTSGQQPTGATAITQATSAMTLQTSLPGDGSAPSSIAPLPQLGSSVSSLSASSVVHSSERLKSVDSSHLSSHQQNQAANSETGGGTAAPSASSPNLLNSIPDKHIDSQSSTESPPDNKVPSEGDENSNHSGLATDTLPEHSGTAALLEHSGVKTENHDSGVGSSSERSDDTPSEPGDGEFRTGHTGTENEDSSKASLQKANCKLEPKVNSTSNTITVGYIMSPGESVAQSKQTTASDSGHGSKSAIVTSAPTATSSSAVSQFYDAHVQNEKQTDLLTGGQQASSINWTAEDNKTHLQSSVSSKGRENGPSSDELGNIPGLKMNGPSSQHSLEKMIIAVNELQQKKMRTSPKQNSKKGLHDVPAEHLKLQAEVLEKMTKLHQFAESAKESPELLHKTNSSDKADSPDSLSQRLGSSDEHGDQLIFDMEELVNGKTMAHSASGVEGKGGSNITSIYSKRSSPVNVNMLNHIYAPGLPLPRRLTESVQRLVKPLPASEMSISTPQVRPCKSPGSGGSPRAGSGTSSHTSLRMSVHSGARSPGASMPKLIPNDKHSLLSGGLDLAGLSSLQYTSTHNTDPSGLASMMVSSKKGASSLSSDVLLKDPHSLSSSQHSPPNLSLDSKSYSGKIFSQSYPPHKSRDLSSSVTHFNHDLVLGLQSNSSLDRNSSPSTSQSSQHNQLAWSKTESSHLLSHECRVPTSNRPPLHDFAHNNHLSSNVADSGQTRLAQQPSSAAETTHSSCNSNSVDHTGPYSTHSNASSPIMPILQRGQEPPGTPTLAFSMPSISSQPPSISSAKAISPTSIGSNAPVVSSATVTTLNKLVPYSSITVSASLGTCGNATAKSPSVSIGLPTLSPVSTTPPALGEIDSTSAASPSYSAPPKLSLSEVGSSTPPKLTKVHLPTNHSPSSPRTGSQYSRNLFESVSGSFIQDNMSSITQEVHICNNHNEVSSHLTTFNKSDSSQSDSISSVLASKESKVDLMVRNMRQKSSESGSSRTSASAIAQKHKAEILKFSTISKPVLSTGEVPSSTPVSTEVVNLDSHISSQPSVTTALTSSSLHTSGMVTITSSEDMNQVGTGAQLNQPPTSLPASVSQSGWSQAPKIDSVSETIASVAAGRDKTTLVMTTSSTSSFTVTSSPVKEPILETLASALSSTTATNTSTVRSFTESQIPASSAISELKRREPEESVVETKMVTIQSSGTPHKSTEDCSGKLAVMDSIGTQTTGSQNSDASGRRITRKRKSTHNEEDSREGDIELSSADTIPIKQARLGNAQMPTVVKSSKSPAPGEMVPSKLEPSSKVEGIEHKDGGKLQSQLKAVGVVTAELHEEEKGLKMIVVSAQEDKDSQRSSRPPRTLVSESKELTNTKDGRPHRSTSSSDESRSNRSSSNESKDSTQREGRTHRNSASSGAEGKEVRGHRTTSGEDKDPGREGRAHRASSVDHKENSHKDTPHKDNRSHRGLTNAHDDRDDHKDGRTQRSASAEDKDKVKSGKDMITEKGPAPDKVNLDLKHDDGQKKHRVKRQFYAYVPERSIDQTYFDTPILSGRTRSKNKPSDLPHNETGAGLDGSSPMTNSVDSQSQNVAAGTQTAPGKTDAATEGAGGKRPTRSVRTKDNPQDQNASKRRRVQQNR